MNCACQLWSLLCRLTCFCLGEKKKNVLIYFAIKIFSSTGRSHPFFCILIVFYVFTSVRLRDVIMYAYGCVGDCREWVWLCTCMCVRACAFPCQSNTHTKKKMEFVNTVYISDRISNIIPLFWVFIQNVYRENYNKIVCYFFCGLSCRRRTNEGEKNVSNSQCFLICVWQYISSFLLLSQNHSPNASPIAMTP